MYTSVNLHNKWHGTETVNTYFFTLSISRCRGLLLLETYTTKEADNLQLPAFLEVEREVTNEPQYSMFNLSDIRTEHVTLF